MLTSTDYARPIAWRRIALAFVLFSLIAFKAQSQCGCTFTIPAGAGTYTFDGVAKGAAPGNVICISAGNRDAITFTNLSGSPTNYITIKNCGGKAVIGKTTSNNAMAFGNSHYIHITGTGDTPTPLGIFINGSAAGSQGLVFAGLSSDLEVDNIEVANTGYTGLMIKTDPSRTNCLDVSACRPNFTLSNVKIHDCYIHNTDGEGIYLGDSFYSGTPVFCGSTQYCHDVQHVRIYNNRFDQTGREAIQCGACTNDIEVYDNVVYNYGKNGLSTQNGGIQFGVGSSGRMYRNFVKAGTGPALTIQGLGNSFVYNNIVVNPGEQAVTINTRPSPLTTDIVSQGYLGGIYLLNNTFIGAGTLGTIIEFVNGAPSNVLYNNLIVNCTNPWDKLYTTTDWKKSNNIYIPVLANAFFANPATDDYHLTAASPAINTGKDVSSYSFAEDFDKIARPSGASWDVGAFEFGTNLKPNVSVGANQIISLPTTSTTVIGSATDPDGSIATYQWTKVSGPTVTFTNETTPTVTLTTLVPGSYVFRLTATDNGGGTGFAQMTIVVNDPLVNQSPQSTAGVDVTITLPTAATILAGSAVDHDGSIASYAWTKISGPAATLAGASSSTLGLSALAQGTYIFRLTVTDNQGATGSDDAQVVVNPAAGNIAPTANAGTDKSLVLPTSAINLVGSGTDTDGTIASYSWIKVSGGAATLAGATTNTLQLTGLAAGSYTFRLTVTDNGGATANDDVIVTVTGANQTPVANAGLDKSITLPTSATTLPGSGSDVDGSVVSYFWSKISGPAATLTNTNAATLSVSGLVAGVYVFRLTVQDNLTATGSDDVQLTVVSGSNIAPTANAGPAQNITLPTSVATLPGSGSDTDGSIASYAWTKVSGPTATLTNATTSTLSLSALVQGTYVFQLKVTDNLGATGTSQVTIVVFPATVNQSPVVNAGIDKTLTLPANSVNITAIASDPDGTIASYLWVKISGPSATLGGTTSSTLALTNLVAGSYTFRVTVTDNGGSTAIDDVNVVVSAANQNPVVNAGTNQTIVLPTSSTSLPATASDPDGTIASYLWTNVSGPTIPTLTGTTTPTLSASALAVGTYIFRVTVTDNLGATAFDDVNVSVQTAANINPIANAGSDQTIFLPTNSINLNGSGNDLDGTIASYAWTKVTGGAATLTNANTAVLSLSGLVAGTYTFRLTVTDNGGATGIDDVTVTVNSAATNQPPVANAGPDISLSLPVNSTNLIGSGSDPDGAISSYTWIKVSGAAATLSNANTPVLSVQDLVEGIYVFSLTVTDGAGAPSTDNVQVNVLPAGVNQSPIVDAGSVVNVILPTNAVNITANAGDPDGSIASYAWTKQVGPTATITGASAATVQLSDLLLGTYVFRITVTDNQGATSVADVTVNVLPVGTNQPPVVTAGADKILFLPTNSTNLLGAASDADGSISVYAWVKLGGPAVTVTNPNSATASLSNLVAGQYTFRLTATDNSGATSFDEVTVTVFQASVNQAPVASAGTNQTIVLPNATTTLNGSGFDTDGSIVSYLWTQASGPAATLTNATFPSLIVDGLTAGTFQFLLTVTDDKGATGADIATITVVPNGTNQAPVANAGTAQVLHLPTNSVTLLGSGTDADGTITTYSWVKKSGPAAGTLSGQATASLALTNLVAGTYVFTLTVTDDDGLTNSKDATVSVLPTTVNQNPTVSVGPDITVRLPATGTTITATASDPDGSIVAYLWTKQSGPSASLGGANTPTVTLSGLVLGTYVFRIEVTDNLGSTSSTDITVNVLPAGANQPPVVVAGSTVTIFQPDNTTVLNGSASDLDGAIATLGWSQTSGPSVTTLSGNNTTTLSVSNLVAGNYVMRLTATDNEGATAFSEATIEVLNNPNAPVVFAGNDTTIVLPTNFIALTGTVTPGLASVIDQVWSQSDGPPADLQGVYPTVGVQDMLTGVYTFKLTAFDNSGLTGSDERVVTVLEGKSNPIGASVVFSPNADAVNDSWTVKNLSMVQTCPLAIYNNLGKKVYEAVQYNNDWNGTLNNGTPLKEGDYYFVFDCGGKKTYSGAFRIIR